MPNKPRLSTWSALLSTSMCICSKLTHLLIQVAKIHKILIASAECSSDILMAFIDGSHDLPKLPMHAIEVLLNLMLGTSTPTLTNLVADVIEKVRSWRHA